MNYNEALEYLTSTVCEMQTASLRTTCRPPLDDSRFLKSSASLYKHQAYEGGLVIHTAEVLKIALDIANGYVKDKVDKDVIITSIIWHDYGKIWEYRAPNDSEMGMTAGNKYVSDTPFKFQRHRWSVRHVARSYAEFLAIAKQVPVPDDLTEHVSHCILAHHGRNEWGSPVEPISIEAFIIHMADTLNARFYDIENPFRTQRTDWQKNPNPLK